MTKSGALTGWQRVSASLVVLAAALVVSLTAGSFWLIGYAFFLLLFGTALAALVLLVAVAGAIHLLFALHGPARLAGLGVLAAVCALAVLPPWMEWGMRIDHALLKGERTRISESFQIAENTLAGHDRLASQVVPRLGFPLSIDNEVFWLEVECGAIVFFPTFYGIPDGVGGFLFVPECAGPEMFPAGLWGAPHLEPRPLGGPWYRVSGT